ncbi:MAG: sigma-70 family RNA polymerase sigma factor [bacterium]|nr:sigma-70 family RNA polymerase sigma factor [bacterium]
MTAAGDRDTRHWLGRWHEGDPRALDALLDGELPRIRAHIERRMGPRMRRFAETDDMLQDAIVDVLRCAPRFRLSDRQAFRALIARLVENAIRDRHAYHSAACRDVRRERAVPRDSVLDLDPPQRGVTRPSAVAARNEDAAWVRLAIDLLAPDDREVLLLRHWHELPFRELAERLGIAENTARMRCQRALPKLMRAMEQLRSGALLEVLDAHG